MNKEAVELAITDWKIRIKDLFDSVCAWLSEQNGELQIICSEITQGNEYFLKKFDVPPSRVPTLTILQEKNRFAFVPSARWIIGANGRINLSTNNHQYILVDLGGKGGIKSNWRITTPERRSELYDFTKDLFFKIIREDKLSE